MPRLLVFILTTFILTVASGQNFSFDQKVEQLFFNVNVSERSASLINQFAQVNQLQYIKPDGYTSFSLKHKGWFHSFKFISQPYLKSKVDTGFIEIIIDDFPGKQIISEIWWRLSFDRKQNAINVFNELKKQFTNGTVISKIYQSELAMETAEFTDK